MTPANSSLIPSEVPPELVHSLTADASEDADNVGLFLGYLGLAPSDPNGPDPPICFPAWFLVELAAALRIWLWEASGLRIHLDAGLAPARESLLSVFCRAKEVANGHASSNATPLMNNVIELSINRLAWSARRDLGAEVVLGEADEDTIVETLANLIWKHRVELSGIRDLET
jgi:hypothetical protein